jgi:hypothetical protein
VDRWRLIARWVASSPAPCDSVVHLLPVAIRLDDEPRLELHLHVCQAVTLGALGHLPRAHDGHTRDDDCQNGDDSGRDGR